MNDSAAEANAIAKALQRDGQTTLAAKWKDQADKTARLEKERHRYVEAAGIVGNLGVHVRTACEERGIAVTTAAEQAGVAAGGLSTLVKRGGNMSLPSTLKILKWLGSTR